MVGERRGIDFYRDGRMLSCRQITLSAEIASTVKEMLLIRNFESLVLANESFEDIGQGISKRCLREDSKERS